MNQFLISAPRLLVILRVHSGKILLQKRKICIRRRLLGFANDDQCLKKLPNEGGTIGLNVQILDSGES